MVSPMSNAHYSDASTTKLRSLVASIEREIVETAPTPALHEAWKQLVAVLALGPEPLRRECPKCHAIGMRAATKCGNCWIVLAPLPPVGVDA